MGRWSGHVNQLKSVLGKDLCHSHYGTFRTVNSYKSLLKMRPEIIKISAKGKKHINNIFSFILCWLLGGPVTVSSGKNEEMGRTQSGKCRGSFWHGQRYLLTMFIPCFLHNSSLSPHCMRGSFASTWHHLTPYTGVRSWALAFVHLPEDYRHKAVCIRQTSRESKWYLLSHHAESDFQLY